jgi:serine/alanine adding enzyme
MTIAEVDPDAWDRLLDRVGCRDVYFRRGYVEASSVLDGGRPALLHAATETGHVLLACSVRSVPGDDTLNDVTTPYGYGGPVATGTDPPVGAFCELYEGWCAQNRIVSTFIRFHPLLENHRHACPSTTTEELAGTVTWRLDGDSDLFDSMHRHHRRVVRKAIAQVEVEVHERPDRLDSFAALYAETMRRQKAASFYFFPPAYWEALARRVSDQLVRFDAVLAGELVASVLCLASPPWLHYHLGGTLEPGRSVGASNLLMLTAARWARERGYEQFHLGGGVGGRRDSLWQYKQRFSPNGRREAWIGKAVHDKKAYAALAGAATQAHGGFFPAYRAATSASVPSGRPR